MLSCMAILFYLLNQTIMKVKLPQGLKLALLASLTAGSVYGEGVSPVEVITVPGDSSTALTGDTTSPGQYSVIAKDGEGAATIVGNVNKYYALAIREGSLKIGDGQTETKLYQNVTHYSSTSTTTALTVAGKDARVVFDKATYTCPTSPEQVVVIGGLDGNGSMLIDNQSNVDFSNGNVTIIGEAKGTTGWSSYTTNQAEQEISEENRYYGNYTKAANGSGKEFGKGIVTVTGESTWKTGYTTLYMSEGELHVKEKSKVQIGAAYGQRFYMGNDSESTSVLNVSGGSKVLVNTQYYYTGSGENSTVNINLSGDGTELTVLEYTPKHPESNGSVATFCYLGANKSYTEINVGNGSTLNLNTITQMGAGSGIAKVAINVEDGGTLEAKSDSKRPYISMNNNTSINNKGTVDVDGLHIWGGEFNNEGTATVGDLRLYGGVINNSGLLNIDQITQSAGVLNCLQGGQIRGVLPSAVTLVFNLTEQNLDEACQTLVAGSTYSETAALTIKLNANQNLKAGKYKLIDATAATLDNSQTRAANVSSITGLDGVTTENISWENKVLTLNLTSNLALYRDPAADAILNAAWGAYKSSQAFTGTLWGTKSNAKKVSSISHGKSGIATMPEDMTIAWATGYGLFSRLSSCNGASGAEYSIHGGAIGVEQLYVSGRTLGVALGYDWGHISPFSTSKVDQQSKHVAVYGRPLSATIGKSLLTLDLAAGLGNTESDYDGLNTEWEQDYMQFDARATYAYLLTDDTTVRGFVEASYFTADSVSTSEMKVSELNNLRFKAGVGAARQLGKTIVFTEAALHYDTHRDNPHVTVNDFDYKGGAKPGRMGGSVSVGAMHQLNEDWSIRGSYTYEHANEHNSHSLNVGAVYAF